MMSTSIFDQINHAVLDLQQAEHNTYSQPLKVLGRLLRSPELADANVKLTSGLDLQQFLDGQEEGASMVGSDVLEWPDNPDESLGLKLLVILRYANNPDGLLSFAHTYYYAGSKYIRDIQSFTRQLVIPFVRDYKAYIQNGMSAIPKQMLPPANKIFIVHGHDGEAKESLARFLERLGLKAIILSEQPNEGRTVIDKFEKHAAEAGYAVVLMTPDDLGSQASGQARAERARQNVIFELGYFAGKLGRGRVCLLRKGDVEIPSDLAGVVYTDLDPGGGWRERLVKELRAAGLNLNLERIYG